MIEELFEGYVGNEDIDLSHLIEDEEEDDLRKSKFTYTNDYMKPSMAAGKMWLNHVLVVCCVRLGMKHVQAEYLEVIRHFFESKQNVGILGGRPGEAYYLLGMQDQHLIFLDPHNTQRAIPSNLDDIAKQHTTYHENQAKKILYTKLDPLLGFAFLVRSHEDLETLKAFMKTGKEKFKDNWIFNAMESKPDFARKSPKKKQRMSKVSVDDDDLDFEQVGQSKDSYRPTYVD